MGSAGRIALTSVHLPFIVGRTHAYIRSRRTEKMTVPKWCLVGVWVVVALGAAVESRAQTTTATLRGKITDEQGAVLPGVAVTARHVDTNTSRSVVTGAVGQYFLPSLPAGRYEVSAELQGFRIERRTDLVLQIGQEVTFDFALKVGGLQETVTVAAETRILETTQNTI